MPSKSSEETQQPWEHFRHILRNFPCQRGDPEFQVLLALVKKHPELLQMEDGQKRSLLAYVVLSQQADVLAWLLSLKSISLDRQDNQGNTPLLLAIKNEYLEGVVLLLACGADPNICNHEGFNAYHLALALDSRDISAILFKKEFLRSRHFPSLTKDEEISIVDEV
jgi:ankyrin repeat protein